LAPPDRLWVGSAGTARELSEVSRDSACWTGRPGILELRLHREEVPPFTPFLPADAPTYCAASGGLAGVGR
jgi:acetolactate synthase-1/2/3 large subunit